MLVLGRLIGEEIYVYLPDGRRGRVVAIDTWQGNPPKRMKIGFDFPKDIKIVRKELLDRDDDLLIDLEIRHEEKDENPNKES